MADAAPVCGFVFKKRGLAAGRGRCKRPSSDQEGGEGTGGAAPGSRCAGGAQGGEVREGGRGARPAVAS